MESFKKKKKSVDKICSLLCLKKDYFKSMKHEGFISSLCVDIKLAGLESKFSSSIKLKIY